MCEPTIKQMNLIRSMVSDDLENFLKLHPQYESRWPSVKKMFSEITKNTITEDEFNLLYSIF